MCRMNMKMDCNKKRLLFPVKIQKTGHTIRFHSHNSKLIPNENGTNPRQDNLIQKHFFILSLFLVLFHTCGYFSVLPISHMGLRWVCIIIMRSTSTFYRCSFFGTTDDGIVLISIWINWVLFLQMERAQVSHQNHRQVIAFHFPGEEICRFVRSSFWILKRDKVFEFWIVCVCECETILIQDRCALWAVSTHKIDCYWKVNAWNWKL